MAYINTASVVMAAGWLGSGAVLRKDGDEPGIYQYFAATNKLQHVKNGQAFEKLGYQEWEDGWELDSAKGKAILVKYLDEDYENSIQVRRRQLADGSDGASGTPVCMGSGPPIRVGTVADGRLAICAVADALTHACTHVYTNACARTPAHHFFTLSNSPHAAKARQAITI